MEEEISTNITIGDLKTITVLIETCASRGTFRINEFKAVADLYNKVTACIQASQNNTIISHQPTD